MANFEAFIESIKLSANLLFLKSVTYMEEKAKAGMRWKSQEETDGE